MKIEDVKIEDAADANYVIRKFFQDQLKNIKMAQLEQLVLTVYNMGKNNKASTGSDGSEGAGLEAPAENAAAKVNPFKINDRARVIEDVEIGHSGEFIKTDTVGTVSSAKEDAVSILVEYGEDGEMIEASVPFDKLEKV